MGAHPEGKFFTEAILELQAIAASIRHTSYASDNLRLPQVHALNCLKDVFTSTSLGTATEPHMAKTLDIAAGCLQADMYESLNILHCYNYTKVLRWAIRNCGLMLFRALLSRMHGGTDAASSRISSNHRRFSKLVYEKYPNLPNLILVLLSSGCKKSGFTDGGSSSGLFAHSLETQRVLPALEIIERSGLPSNHGVEIQEALRTHMQSPVWAVREKSAKALAAVVKDRDLIVEIRDLCKTGRNQQNALHGSLLCIRSMIARLGIVSIGKFTLRSKQNMHSCTLDGLKLLLPQLVTAYDDLVVNNKCPLTAAAYIHIIADIFELLTRNHGKKAYLCIRAVN